MSLQTVRFLHSSDWQLEVPMGGVPNIPASLREPFLDAPYQAAERVVQTAIEEKVDFVLLSGNLLSLETASPYSFDFLLRQFVKLHEQQIAVYWLGGEFDDLDLWPTQLDLPDNVHFFPVGMMHHFHHQRDGKQVAELMGQSWRRESSFRARDFAGTNDGIPRIAVCSGDPPKRSLENKGVDYWAFGGRSHYEVLMDGTTTAVFCGSPQGRQPSELDGHGAVLVECSATGVSQQLLDMDVWRWREERVEVGSDIVSIEDLKVQMSERLAKISHDSTRYSWLIVWSIICRGGLAVSLWGDAGRNELLRSLRGETENDSRWTMAIEALPSSLSADLTEEDTILGDFLRAVQKYRQNTDAWQELLPYLPAEESSESVAAILQRGSDDDRELLWQRVSTWGADLLSGDAAVQSVDSPS